MANFERYEPRADKGRAFDGGESEDQDEEGSRLPLLLVIGLLVVAAFAGVVWLAYTQGVQRGQADAPRLLVAANGPVKVAPANPGGVETPFKGLKIYQQPAPADDEDAEFGTAAPDAEGCHTTENRRNAAPAGGRNDGRAIGGIFGWNEAGCGARRRTCTATQGGQAAPSVGFGAKGRICAGFEVDGRDHQAGAGKSAGNCSFIGRQGGHVANRRL